MTNSPTDEADETIDTFDELVQQCDALRAENERLHTTLEQIANADNWHPDDMQNLARATLAGPKKGLG